MLQLLQCFPGEGRTLVESTSPIPVITRAYGSADDEHRRGQVELFQHLVARLLKIGIAVIEGQNYGFARRQFIVAPNSKIFLETEHAIAAPFHPPHLPTEPGLRNYKAAGALAGAAHRMV